MIKKPEVGFSYDQAVTKESDDKLNRAGFAQRIAGVLTALPQGQGLVIGIHGPWGDGKTTVLNLLRGELGKDTKTAVSSFNPWRFTDEGAMLAGFFDTVAEAVSLGLKTRKEEWAGYLSKIGRYTSFLDERVGKVAEVAGTLGQPSLEVLRDRLCVALRDSSKRIVVLVDDIDRLDKHETHTLFRLIKACADFPNVSYVLAFDEAAVAKALGDRYGGGGENDGRAFLEKIIQIPLKVPVADEDDLRVLCFSHVDRALRAADIDLSEPEVNAFITAFQHGCKIRLKTPRAANRYGNALLFAVPALKGEVNPVDQLLVEALRAFYPAAYDCVRANGEFFCGVNRSSRFMNSDDNKQGSTLLGPILETYAPAEQEAVKELLCSLFPRLKGQFGNWSYGSNWLGQWAKEKRVSSPEYFSRYFSYTIGSRDVRDSVVSDILDSAKQATADSLCALLEDSISNGKAARLIGKLRGIERTIDLAVVEPLSRCLARVGGKLPNPSSLFSFSDPPSQAAILISHLVQRLDGPEHRLALAKKIIMEADPVWFGAECIRWLHVTDDPEKSESNAVTTEQESELCKLFLDRIKSRAADGHPLFDPQVRQEQSLLSLWRHVEGKEATQRHLLELFERDPLQVGNFLEAYAPRSWSMGDVLPHVGNLDGDNVKNIAYFIEMDVMAQIVIKHIPGDYSDPQFRYDSEKPIPAKLAEQFMFVHKMWKAEGRTFDEDVPKSVESQEVSAAIEADVE